MSFLSLILALLGERYLNLGKDLRDYAWFGRYRDFLVLQLAGRPWYAGWPGLLLVLFLPALAAELVLGVLQGWLFSLPALLFATAVLLYCLGPESLWATLARYFEDMERDDAQGAYHHVADRVCAECAESETQLGREVTGWILREANARWFGVLFWFVVLGPAGAILYRLMQVYGELLAKEESGHREPLAQLQRLADWLPARLTGFGYALSGDFVQAWEACRRHAAAGPQFNETLLVEAGTGALDLGEAQAGEALTENRAALELVERTLIVQVVLLSVLSVLGLMW